MTSLRKIDVYGTPYEQGVQQGKAFQSLILANVQSIRDELNKSNLNMERYHKLTALNASFLQKTFPDQWEELLGIANGSDIPFEDIITINIPTYFMKKSFAQECSMLLVRGDATADGCTYLIKNRDMEMPFHQVSVTYHYPDGSSISEVGGAGIITFPAIGVNDAGLTVTSTGTSTGIPSNAKGIVKVDVSDEDFGTAHIFVSLHHLLRNCRTTEDVLDYLNSYPRLNGLNLIAADERTAAVVETTRNGYLVEWVDDSGILSRSNHYCISDYIYNNPSREQYPSTYLRKERIEALLSQQKRKLRFQDLVRIMSDHENSPVNGICRHANELSPAQTASCSICCLEDRELFTTPGNPCEHLILSSL